MFKLGKIKLHRNAAAAAAALVMSISTIAVTAAPVQAAKPCAAQSDCRYA